MLLKLCEQMVSATHNPAPSIDTLHAELSFTIAIYNSPVPVWACAATNSHSRYQPYKGRNACAV